ncbi:UNVERIFIED_CONTAM: hypothetical protein ABIC26_005196 [Paenibacillus sp. PvR008]
MSNYAQIKKEEKGDLRIIERILVSWESNKWSASGL